MEIQVVGGYGGESPECRLTCLLINGTVAIDAGSLCQVVPLEGQVAIRNILVTHSHIDHTNGLPFFIDNVFGRNEGGLDVYGSGPTIYAVRKHLFNSAIWPDFSRLPNHLTPSVRFNEFSDEVAFEIEGVTYTPIPVNHVVPTHGLLIEQGDAAVLWSSDTGPTDRLWEIANRTDNLKAVCIEVSFDNDLQQIADVAGHLTPASLATELEKLERSVPILIHHMKPFCIEQIRREIEELGNDSVGFLEQDRTYSF